MQSMGIGGITADSAAYRPGGNEDLVEAEGDVQQIKGLLLNRRGSSEHIEGWNSLVFRLNPVLDDGRQIAQQSLKAVHGGTSVG